jgi:SNF2 family DNA or RNA helicase
MDKDQRDIYDSMEQEFFIELDNEGGEIHAPGVLAQLMRLRQINLEPRILGIKDVSSSKTEFLEELIGDMLVESEDKVNGTDPQKLVIFSCFESYIRYLDALLPLEHGVITGGVAADDQADIVDRFQTDPKFKLVLGTIQCMGEGITLTASSNVVLADRWWNPAVNNQAIDRTHRIGQKNAVQVITPVNELSIDQSLDRILEGKATLSGAYLGDDDSISAVVDDLRTHRNKAQSDQSEEEEDPDDDQ